MQRSENESKINQDERIYYMYKNILGRGTAIPSTNSPPTHFQERTPRVLQSLVLPDAGKYISGWGLLTDTGCSSLSSFSNVVCLQCCLNFETRSHLCQVFLDSFLRILINSIESAGMNLLVVYMDAAELIELMVIFIENQILV